MFGKEENKNVLKLSQRIGYGVGHVMNDICSAMWFSYTLLFFEVVLEMPSALAGILIFIGQLTDAIASPIVGVIVDRHGTRKSWHMLGTALIAFSFSLIFSTCPWGPDSPSNRNNSTDDSHSSHWDTASITVISLGVFYYAVLITIFQTGWSIVQIAHLAIIPEMTPDKSGRTDLTAIRLFSEVFYSLLLPPLNFHTMILVFQPLFGFLLCCVNFDMAKKYTATVGASIFVYLVTWFILHVTGKEVDTLGPGDSYKFKDIVLIGLLIGGIFTMWFHAILNAPGDSSKQSKDLSSGAGEDWFTVIKKYFKSCSLYQVTLLYFSSRMILNISLVYMPLYLVEKMGTDAEYIATVPLASYISSFLASLAVRQTRSFCSNKSAYLIGALLSIGASVWIGIGFVKTAELFGISILLGAGSSITNVASLSLCADLVGTDTENGALVYGLVTAADKLLGGIAVILIENFKFEVVASSSYYQDVLAYGCGVATLIGALSLMTMFIPSLSPKSER